MIRRSSTALLLSLMACAPASSAADPVVVPDPRPHAITLADADSLVVASPDGRNVVAVETGEDGRLRYSVRRNGRNVIMPSRLGFEFRGAAPVDSALRIANSTRRSYDQTWTQPWGEVREVREHYNELRITVEEAAGLRRRLEVVFRVFDDGLGFRYELPSQGGFPGDFAIEDELTEFNFANDGLAWWIPSDRRRLDRSEMLYSSSRLSLIDSVQTPLTVEMQDGTWVVIHEADLYDYPRMFLANTNPNAMESRRLVAALAPMADGVKARGRAPFVTPWRSIQLADRVEDLVPNVLTLNLNPPSRIDDTSWIRPMRYVGIWWGMHINTHTWTSGPIHGATTANAKQYIDFAAANGFGGVLVEGWNIGWDGDWIGNSELFSFTQEHPDYDLEEVTRYAASKGVELIMHNETSGGIENYERQLEEAFDLYESLSINAIKSGYVADEVLGGHSHYSQPAVRHHRRVIEEAAERGIMMNVHEPIHDTGERRTWPNMMTREGARGQEYNAWGGDGGNPPEHETILFFTRMLSGPMDYTPGVLDIFLESSPSGPRSPEDARPRTTVAKQLALYVVLYSPFQMAADLIENYEGRPEFQFIRDVAVDWEQTRVLDAVVGDYVIVARQERGSDEWFLGAITDEHARSFEVDLAFLPAGREYVAEIYADGDGANWLTRPLSVLISQQRVTRGSTLTIEMAPGGGQAIRFRPE